MKPLVSVIVPTYKQEESLKKALESLANQTYDNIEIVLIDDNDNECFNEKVKKIVDDFISVYPQIKLLYLINHPNLGSAKTRNRGIESCSGEYVTFLDDDDVYLPNKVRRQLDEMTNSNADFSITDLYLFTEEGKLIDKRVRYYIKETDCKTLMTYHLKYHLTGTDTMMYKKEYLIKIGGFDTQDLGDEYYLMEKAIQFGGSFCYVPVCDVHAVVHTGEMGLSSGQNKINCENQLFEHKKQYLDVLSKKDKRYVKMRHYAVLAFAGIKMKKWGYALKNGIKSFFCAPFACVRLVIDREK